MGLKEQINSDLKTALLAGDKTMTTTLRGLKSSILNAEIASGKRDEGLEDEEIVGLLRKEAKKRQESAELYEKGGNSDKAQAEKAEIEVINRYLPKQMSDQDLDKAIDQAISEVEDPSIKLMGKLIARTKELTKGEADGGRIAAAVKRKVTRQQ